MTLKRQAAGLGGPPAARVCAAGELPAAGTDAYLATEAAGVGADDQVSADGAARMRRLLCNIHGPQEFAALGLVNAGFGALGWHCGWRCHHPPPAGGTPPARWLTTARKTASLSR